MRKFPKFSTLRVTLLSVVAFALLLTPRAYATFANFVVVQLQGQCTDASQPASCSLIESAEHDLFSGTATAFGDSSGLHALASVGGSTDQAGGFNLSARAGSQLIDFWEFAPLSESSVHISLVVTTVGSGSAFTQLNIGSSTGDECSFSDSGACTVDLFFDPTFGLSLSLLLSAQAQCDVFFGTGGGSCLSVSDYLDTSFISSVSFTDVNGNPIDVQFESQSGLIYPMPQPVNVPEPTTLALLGVAVAGIGIARRRARSIH